jgi:elongator complex protein 3
MRLPQARDIVPGEEFETLFGLLRLRIQDKPVANLGEIGQDAALIRELHVFGPELPLNQRQETAAQHRGFGKALLREAERIAKEEFHRSWIAVLSGVGAREYYRTEGYTLRNYFMVKKL